MADLRPAVAGDERNSIEDKFIVPYQQNPYFTGHKVFLQTLKEKLFTQVPRQYNHRIALYGMGGIGKTQITLQYIYAYRACYDRVYWIRAVDISSLLSGYQTIAREARIPIPAHYTPTEIARAVLVWLRQTGRWLLVIDNLDDITVVDNLLPENGPGEHTLISTRNPNSAGIPATGVEVPLLDHDDAVALLSTLSGLPVAPGSPEESQVNEIVRELGHLPLAIEQAGAYVREVTGSFTGYWEEYQRNHRELHRWVPKGNRPYRDSVATTWSMSFKIVQANHGQAADLLRLLAYLNPDGILLDFLRDGGKGLKPELQQLLVDQNQLAAGLLELEKVSLVKWDRLKGILSIHRLIQYIVRDEMSDTEKVSTLSAVIDLCYTAFPISVTCQTRPLCRLYRDQVAEPLRWAHTIRTKRSADFLVTVSNFMFYEWDFQECEQYLLQAFDIDGATNGRGSTMTLQTMHRLAILYSVQGRTAEANKLLEELLEKRKDIYGEEAPQTLSVKCSILQTYIHEGRYSEVAELAPALIEVIKATSREADMHLVTPRRMLMSAYVHLGRLAEAAELGEQLLQETKAFRQEEEHIIVMIRLLAAYSKQGRLKDAAKIGETALKNARNWYGEFHYYTLLIISHLGDIYSAQGRTTEAIFLQEDLLAKQMKRYGEENRETLETMVKLASSYEHLLDFVKASELYKKVLEYGEKVPGEDHPWILESKERLAGLYIRQGEVKERAEIKDL